MTNKEKVFSFYIYIIPKGTHALNRISRSRENTNHPINGQVLMQIVHRKKCKMCIIIKKVVNLSHNKGLLPNIPREAFLFFNITLEK